MQESQFLREMEAVKEELLRMGGLVEWAVDGAARALKDRDAVVAGKIIEGDAVIDDLENAIDEHCLRLLATRQPVAKDLRFITAIMKICGNLERIADQAVNVAERVETLVGLDSHQLPSIVMDMASEAQEMVGDSLNALVQRDASGAMTICRRDDKIDRLYHQLVEMMIQDMLPGGRLTQWGLEIILAGRHIERIGDEATNICEEVVFMVEGTIIRHQPRCGLDLASADGVEP